LPFKFIFQTDLESPPSLEGNYFSAAVSTMETNTCFTTNGMGVGFLNGSVRGLGIFWSEEKKGSV